MFQEKSCYLCKNLIFISSTTNSYYYCTVTNQEYTKEPSDFECFCYSQENEE